MRVCTASGLGVLSFSEHKASTRWHPALDADRDEDRRLARAELMARWNLTG